MSKEFIDNLNRASKDVEKWPKWKINAMAFSSECIRKSRKEDLEREKLMIKRS